MDLRMRLCVAGLVLFMAMALVAAGGAGKASAATVIINQPKVNVRSGPGTSYSKVGEVSAGERLEAIETKGEWVKVRLASGREGWVWSPLIDSEIEGDSTFFVVTVDRANLRKGPSTSDALVGSVTRGTSLPAVAVRGQWVKVAWNSGHAWVYAPLGQMRALNPADLVVGGLDRRVQAVSANTPMRSSPAGWASVIARLGAGATGKYLGSEGGWVQVQWNGKTGWIEGKYVRVSNAGSIAKSADYSVSPTEWTIKPATLGKVKGSYVNLRAGAGTSHKKVGQLRGGQAFRVLGSKSGWYQVVTESGQTGWISSSYAQMTQSPPVRSVSLRSISVYSRQLVVEGAFGSPIVRQVDDGKALAIWFQNNGGSPAKIDLNTFELGAISLNQNGIRVDFSEKPNLQVAESKPGRVVVSMETTITRVAVEKKPDRDVVSVSTLGYADPALYPHDDGTAIDLVIPGATLTTQVKEASAGQLVKGVRAGKIEGGVSLTLQVPSWKRHIVRRSPNLVTVEFLKPGLAGKTIVIDPGHGGSDPGAIGPKGLYERVPNLKIGLALKSLLEKEGAKVVMTRSDDSAIDSPQGGGEDDGHTGNLAARVAKVTEADADLYLSIHNNANTDRSKSGSTTYYSASALNVQASKALAQLIQSELVRALGRVDNGVRTAEYYVTRTCPVPSVLAEVLFISNPEEESLLTTDQHCRQAANGLLFGLKKYYS